jgi:hypothetical protein
MANWEAIYLGNFASIDPTEGNASAENAGALVGLTFGGPGDPISADTVDVQTYNSGSGSSTALDQDNNNGSYDWIRTDIGSGLQWYRFDAAATYNATLTFVDGTSTDIVAVLFQDVSGNTFLSSSLNNATNVVLESAPIRSLTLNSLNGSNYSGLFENRPAIDFIPCFARGTIIDTPSGPQFVETLRVGDLVLTADHGAQPLIWTGGRVVDGMGSLAPIRFATGALGNLRPLLVSPQHRILVSGWRAELNFGQPEILVPAKGLVNDTTIRPAPMRHVSYHHLLFERHEIVISEGIESESFHPGRALLTHDKAIFGELVRIFPELSHPDFQAPYDTARPCVKPIEGRLLFG